MFETLGMRRIHSIHRPLATDTFITDSILQISFYSSFKDAMSTPKKNGCIFLKQYLLASIYTYIYIYIYIWLIQNIFEISPLLWGPFFQFPYSSIKILFYENFNKIFISSSHCCCLELKVVKILI